jgi:peptidoglycan-N-acetylglucosamine deacetylase
MAETRRGPGSLFRRVIGRVRREALSLLGRTSFGTITSVATDRPLIALTFDDGPHPDWTPRVLDVLDRYGAKGTFFVVGEHAARYPDVMKRLHQGGHALGNHGQRHLTFPLISAEKRRLELRACSQALAAYPQARRLFRPPHLDQSFACRFVTWRFGYDVIACNRHATDWEHATSEEMIEALGELAAGDVVMLHDALYGQPHRSRAAMIEALDTVLRTHAPRFEFVTVPALLQAGRARRELWLKVPPRSRVASRHGGVRRPTLSGWDG